MTGQDLRIFRKAHRWTQLDLSLRLGVTETSVYRWEHGLRRISTTVELLCATLAPTTTTDGWTISTVEQDGEYAGEEMGRVWLKDPTPRTNRWTYYQADSVPGARRLAARATEMTQAGFETFYAAEEERAQKMP